MAVAIKKSKNLTQKAKEEKTINKPEENLAPSMASSEASSKINSLSEENESLNTEQVELPGATSFWGTRVGKVWTLVFLLCLIIAVTIGFMIFQSINKGNDMPQESTSSPIPTVQVTTSPTPKEVDRSKYKITILNGSKTEGAAGRLRDALEKYGFIVNEVGNADNSDYSGSEIQAGEGVDEDFISALEKVTKDFITSTTKVGTSSSESEVIIIVGQDNSL